MDKDVLVNVNYAEQSQLSQTLTYHELTVIHSV